MQLPVSGLLFESGMLDVTVAAVEAGAFAAGALTFLRLGFKSLLSLLDRLPVGSTSALLAYRQAHLGQLSLLLKQLQQPTWAGKQPSLKHA